MWGSDYVGDTKTLDVHVKRLRSKIEPDPANPTRIVTIRGLGYKYERERPTDVVERDRPDSATRDPEVASHGGR